MAKYGIFIYTPILGSLNVKVVAVLRTFKAASPRFLIIGSYPKGANSYVSTGAYFPVRQAMWEVSGSYRGMSPETYMHYRHLPSLQLPYLQLRST